MIDPDISRCVATVLYHSECSCALCRHTAVSRPLPVNSSVAIRTQFHHLMLSGAHVFTVAPRRTSGWPKRAKVRGKTQELGKPNSWDTTSMGRTPRRSLLRRSFPLDLECLCRLQIPHPSRLLGSGSMPTIIGVFSSIRPNPMPRHVLVLGLLEHQNSPVPTLIAQTLLLPSGSQTGWKLRR